MVLSLGPVRVVRPRSENLGTPARVTALGSLARRVSLACDQEGERQARVTSKKWGSRVTEA